MNIQKEGLVRKRHGNKDNLGHQSKSTEKAANKNKYTTLSKDLHAATSSKTHRLWTRSVIIIAVIILVYFYTKNKTKETKLALVREVVPLRMQKFVCSKSYELEIKSYPECMPKKCGRLVMDKLVEQKEVEILLDLVRRVFSESGGSEGGASILDLHTGILSYSREKFDFARANEIEEYTGFIKMFEIPQLMALFRDEHLTVYNAVKEKIKRAISEQFGIAVSALHLTYPTFFSRLTNATATIANDEYWHEHVDKETYECFHYTSLLYLNTYNRDFKGGRFIFVDGAGENRTTAAVEPKMGRVNAFTSGAENRHHVERVTDGERYAITISFTCNQFKGISDPRIKNNN